MTEYSQSHQQQQLQQQQQQSPSADESTEQVTRRFLIHCELHKQSEQQWKQFVRVLDDFVEKYPQWSGHVDFMMQSSPVFTQSYQDQETSPIFAEMGLEHQVYKPDATHVGAADICVVVMGHFDFKTWLSKGDHQPTAHIINIDNSSDPTFFTPPLSPMDQPRIVTDYTLYILPLLLHFALLNVLNDEITLDSYPDKLRTKKLLDDYINTRNERLFILDYDGALAPIVSRPELALPSSLLLNHLEKLCNDPLNSVWIISGYDQTFLDSYFGHLENIGLCAEHGCFMKKPNQPHWIEMIPVELNTSSWKNQAKSVFERFTTELPGTELEQKAASLTWHYGNAHDLDLAIKKSHDCHQQLLDLSGMTIVVNKMNLEARSILVNKGVMVKRILETLDDVPNMMVCMGADEDMFKALVNEPLAYSIMVGSGSTSTLANYYVDSSDQAISLLGKLTSSDRNRHFY